MSLIAERLPELLRRGAYPRAASDVRLIETHISWVLLAGQYAYKLRKPVDFGFLDFTSVDKRRADCEAQVEQTVVSRPRYDPPTDHGCRSRAAGDTSWRLNRRAA